MEEPRVCQWCHWSPCSCVRVAEPKQAIVDDDGSCDFELIEPDAELTARMLAEADAEGRVDLGADPQVTSLGGEATTALPWVGERLTDEAAIELLYQRELAAAEEAKVAALERKEASLAALREMKAKKAE